MLSTRNPLRTALGDVLCFTFSPRSLLHQRTVVEHVARRRGAIGEASGVARLRLVRAYLTGLDGALLTDARKFGVFVRLVHTVEMLRRRLGSVVRHEGAKSLTFVRDRSRAGRRAI